MICFSTPALETFSSNLDTFQTLIAGVFALVGAGLTIRKMQQQIDEEKKRHQEIRAGQKRQSIAGLPNAVITLQKYIKYSYAYAQSADEESEQIEFPTKDSEIIRSSIEYLDEQTSHAIVDFFRFMQVHHSRLTWKKNTSISPRNRVYKMYDCLLLQAAMYRILNYSREDIDLIANWCFSTEDLEEAFKGINDYSYVHMPKDLDAIVYDQSLTHSLWRSKVI